MSEEKQDDRSCCASCGVAEVDDVKLTDCSACDIVRYCSDECQQDHRLKHKLACRKRAVELRDELLFRQPEGNHLGDCSICCLPMPLEITKSTVMECCSKTICNGCFDAYRMRVMEASLDQSCPFCRNSMLGTEEYDKRRMERIAANDPVALRIEGVDQYKKGDHKSAFDYHAKAAKFGSVEAHYKLALMYNKGHGVEKDKAKEVHHLEEAAIGGHPEARCLLGGHEIEIGNFGRAVKHWIIAATQGGDDSIHMLMEMFKLEFVSKEELTVALRAHRAALNATKSSQRDAANRNRDE